MITDGSAKVRTDYPLLFTAIGVAWGAGDGSTTFNIPDLRDRALYGSGGRVGIAETDGVAFGSRGGPNHHHNFNQTAGGGGDHSHSVSGSTDSQGNHFHGVDSGLIARTDLATAALGSGGTSRYIVNGTTGISYAGSHSHGISGSTSGSGSHNHNVSGDTSGGYLQDRPSYAGVIYAISIGTAA